MADKLNNKTQETNTINLNELGQIEYWTEILNCTEPQLRSVIRLVGNNLIDVKKYFTKQ